MFKIGQKVVCKNSIWYDEFNEKPVDGPKKGFVYEIEVIRKFDEDTIGLSLKGFNLKFENGSRRDYNSKYFEPYIDPQLEMNKVKEELIDKELILN